MVKVAHKLASSRDYLFEVAKEYQVTLMGSFAAVMFLTLSLFRQAPTPPLLPFTFQRGGLSYACLPSF